MPTALALLLAILGAVLVLVILFLATIGVVAAAAIVFGPSLLALV